MARRLAPGFRIGQSFKARFSPDGTRLATLGKRITLWDVASRSRIAYGPPLSNASSVDFSPDASLLAAKNTSGEVLVMGVPELDERARYSGRGFGEGTDIQFAPDGRHLVDGSWTGLLSVRDAMTGAVVWQEAGDMVSELARTRDRRTWVSKRSTRDGSGFALRAWPFAERPPEPVPELQRASEMAISDDGRRLALASRGLTVLERDGGAWRVSASIADLPTTGTGDGLAWSPDGERLAYAGGRRATVFDAALNEVHHEDLRYACDVDFNPAGTLLALGDWSAGVVISVS